MTVSEGERRCVRLILGEVYCGEMASRCLESNTWTVVPSHVGLPKKNWTLLAIFYLDFISSVFNVLQGEAADVCWITR